ncbi:anthranilate phosphoribosyltransferase [Kwoniella shandongensis]|uniref:Anthranilate phosphoribosyltransferase n=1 Tax=Kwoniella shandongensis TaxID=1734106 RepID=A0A5M6C8Y3_9TREE|nr:anthranilate phosphoribosyltransferase [Kwoniella shandongensis]KAA5529649.1 anthranilate phosphoribosyltransferase [Kwoniella shandongensis]
MSKDYTPDSFKVLLKKLVQSPDEFTPEDCALCFRHLCVQGASEAQAGAFLTALTLSGLESSAEIVAACAAVLREHAVSVQDLIPNPSVAPEHGMWDYRDSDKEGDGYQGLVDIVGTGGDGWDTYNVSTTAAVVVAGAGVRVAKHGSKAATSTSGSADLLLSLDCRLAFPVSEVKGFLAHSPFLFLFAPHYHPSLAHIAPIRRNLNFRTIFNVLGPLINPSRPQRMLLGVAKRDLGDTFAEVLRLLGVERALVVCGKEGLDEISPEGETWTWWLENGEITKGEIHPTRDFGLPSHPLSTVRGSTPDLNALTFNSILSPHTTQPPSHLSSPVGPDSPSFAAINDYVLLNAAALLHVSGKAASYKEGVAIARESIESGGAKLAFEGFRDASKKAMGEHIDQIIVEDDGGVAAKNGTVKAWLKARRDRSQTPKELNK